MSVWVPGTDGNAVEAYVGKVVATRHENLGSDSYWTAYVWDDASGKIIEVSDGSTAYGGPRATGKVDATVDIVSKVSDMLISDLKDALEGNHYADRSPKLGMRVKSLTSKGKAFGVVGEIVGEGTGNYGPFFKVKDENTGRVVIVSRGKVSALDLGVMDRKCLALHVALSILSRDGGRVSVEGYAREGKSYVAELVKDAKESMIENMDYYATTDELLNDFREEGHAVAFIVADRLI